MRLTIRGLIPLLAVLVFVTCGESPSVRTDHFAFWLLADPANVEVDSLYVLVPWSFDGATTADPPCSLWVYDLNRTARAYTWRGEVLLSSTEQPETGAGTYAQYLGDADENPTAQCDGFFARLQVGSRVFSLDGTAIRRLDRELRGVTSELVDRPAATGSYSVEGTGDFGRFEMWEGDWAGALNPSQSITQPSISRFE